MEDSPNRDPSPAAAALGRRQFIRKAAVAGAIAWTVPTIVSIAPAGASERHSTPPKPPVKPISGVGASPGIGAKHKDPEQLPFTGDNEILELGVGVAAIAAGAALLISSAETKLALDATKAFRAEQ